MLWCPCLPTPIAELKKTVDTFKDKIKDGLELCGDILEMTSNPALKSAFKSYTILTSHSKHLVPGYCVDNWGSRSHRDCIPTCDNACGTSSRACAFISLLLGLQHKQRHQLNEVKKGSMRVMGMISPLQRGKCLLLLNNLHGLVDWSLLTRRHWKCTSKGAIRSMCGSVALPHVKRFTTHLHLLGYTSEINIQRISGTTAMLENVNMDMMK